MSKLSLELMVLNYNGIHLLQACLPSVMMAARRCRTVNASTVVIDNCSTDESNDWVMAKMPDTKFAHAPSNDYLFSLNWAAHNSTADLLLMLNNDVEMPDDCIDPLLEPLLADPQVFSVTPFLLRRDRIMVDAEKRWGEFRRGLLHHESQPRKQVCATLFPTGGAFVVRRSDFCTIGGFDRIYHPAYAEDLDIGYRAWRYGYKNLYQPQSLMIHWGSATMSQLGHSKRYWLNMRNTWLLSWRNVSDPQILAMNMLWTIRYYLSSIVHRNTEQRKSLQGAFARWNAAVAGRTAMSSRIVRPDRDICSIIAEE